MKTLIKMIIFLLLISLLIFGFFYFKDLLFKYQFTNESKELSRISFLSKCSWQLKYSDHIIENHGPSLLCVVEVNDKKTINSDKEKIINELKSLGWNIHFSVGEDLRFEASKNNAYTNFNLANCSAGVSEYNYCLSYIQLSSKP